MFSTNDPTVQPLHLRWNLHWFQSDVNGLDQSKVVNGQDVHDVRTISICAQAGSSLLIAQVDRLKQKFLLFNWIDLKPWFFSKQNNLDWLPVVVQLVNGQESPTLGRRRHGFEPWWVESITTICVLPSDHLSHAYGAANKAATREKNWFYLFYYDYFLKFLSNHSRLCCDRRSW